MRPIWLPNKVTISLKDVSESRLNSNMETDPNNCPLVLALRRIIPSEWWLHLDG
jgi:hypothetical protein